MPQKVDPLRVVQDPAYAASLTEENWRTLSNDPEWNELLGEFHELTEPVIALYASNLGMPAPQAVRPVSTSATTADQFNVIGKRVPRLHGLGVVTSLGQYTQNMRMNGMLFTRTLRSPHPHAKVRSVNIRRAQSLPGVVAVLHRDNLPAEYRDVKLGSGPPDRFLFNEEIFEIGSPIAVVAAENEHIADEAIHLIDVDYEVLPATLDMMEGASPNALKQWDNQQNGTIIAVTPPLVRGNPDAARADTTVEAVTTSGIGADELAHVLGSGPVDRVLHQSTRSRLSRRPFSGAQDSIKPRSRHPARLHGIWVWVSFRYRSGRSALGHSGQNHRATNQDDVHP
jgi:hypothetical protein